ncbi:MULTISPECIES: hypothetical protein [unclassified Bradyrhizobium]|jgi:hypothetical protein|uniref:hypothetical protein n=1 Tax=unclassified Bradyrhizobium TaxID=2631580 RepID=UPI002FF06AAC
MHELTHPVELRDEELELVAAGSGCRCHNGSLINVSDNVVQANVAGIVVGDNKQTNFNIG